MSLAAGPAAVIARLSEAINAHDIDAIVDCFADDVLAEHPANPERNFRGRHQLRANWAITFETVIGLDAEFIRWSVDAETVWVEWCWRGTLPDGSEFARAGVAVHGVEEGRIAWIRVYMEPIRGQSSNGNGSTVAEMARHRP